MPVFRVALQEEVDPAQASPAMGLAELVRAICTALGAQVVASAPVSRIAGTDTTGALDPTRFTLLIGGFLALIALVVAVCARFGSHKGKIA